MKPYKRKKHQNKVPKSLNATNKDSEVDRVRGVKPKEPETKIKVGTESKCVRH